MGPSGMDEPIVAFNLAYCNCNNSQQQRTDEAPAPHMGKMPTPRRQPYSAAIFSDRSAVRQE